MSVVVTADWHLSDNPRDDYRHAFQPKLRALLKEHEAKCLLILGDLTEEKDHHSAWLVNTMVSHLVEITNICDVVILRGNHDYIDPNFPFWAFLGNIPRIHWVNEPTRVHLSNLPVLELGSLGDTLLLPHTNDYRKEWKGLKLKQWDWIFAHQTFAGAQVHPDHKLKGIPTSIFGDSRVISGDIHVPQIVDKCVEYVGAPYTVDFGDRYQPRVLLLERDRVRTIKVTGPQKRLVEISALSMLKPGSTAVRYVNKGDILKVRVQIERKDIITWYATKQEVREKVEAMGCTAYTVEPVILESLREGKPKSRDMIETKPDEQVVMDYTKKQGRDNLTAKSGLNIMRRS